MALNEHEISYDIKEYWRHIDPESKDSAKELADFLTMPKGPTAIFAWSPKLATQILKVACNLGLNIPKDLSLVASCYENVHDVPVSGFVLPHQQLAQCLFDE